MTNYCKCGGKVALGTSGVNYMDLDQEPFDCGVIERDSEDINIESFNLSINACVECGKVYEVSIMEDFDDKYAKVVELPTKDFPKEVSGEIK